MSAELWALVGEHTLSPAGGIKCPAVNHRVIRLQEGRSFVSCLEVPSAWHIVRIGTEEECRGAMPRRSPGRAQNPVTTL